jgi:hypothetical protein
LDADRVRELHERGGIMRRMRVMALVLLVSLPVAAGSKEAAARKQVDAAMRDFYGTLRSKSDGNIRDICDRLIAALPHIGGKEQSTVRNSLDRVFDARYKRTPTYLRCVADVIASNGKRGINKLHNRYTKLKRSYETRAVIAAALGDCKNVHALTVLRKMMHDKEPLVAVAAIDGCAKYSGETKKAKYTTMRDMINLYAKVTAKAQGKGIDTKERMRYMSLKPAFDKALNAYSDDAKLDSAQAWDAWLREKMAKKE